jgi:hypothetical protein
VAVDGVDRLEAPLTADELRSLVRGSLERL